MLDHIGMPISDFERSKAFYLKGLRALGYELVMEVRRQGDRKGRATPASAPRASRSSGSAPASPSDGQVHFAFIARDRAGVRAFHAAALKSAPKTMARRACARIITRITTVRSCSTLTGTISRPFATCRNNATRVLASISGDAPKIQKPETRFAISGFETQERLERQGSGPLLCPGAHPGRRRTVQIPARLAALRGTLLRRLLHRLLLRRLLLRLYCCLSHLSALSLVSRSNQFELVHDEQIRLVC